MKLFNNLRVRIFNWLSLDGQKCLSFGGLGRDGNIAYVRVCEKNRRHIDSHAYVFEEHTAYWEKGSF